MARAATPEATNFKFMVLSFAFVAVPVVTGAVDAHWAPRA